MQHQHILSPSAHSVRSDRTEAVGWYRQQLFDPSSSKLFWFPERPRGQPQHPGGHGGMPVSHDAAGCAVTGQASGLGPGDGLGPATYAANDIAGTGNPPRAQNLLDLVPTTQPVDAARAAAAGATAQQPFGLRQAAELADAADDGAALCDVDGAVMHGQGATGSDALMDAPSDPMRALPTLGPLRAYRLASILSIAYIVHKQRPFPRCG